jgi:hypothetical protein
MTATYIALATITLTTTDSEIVFSSIPNTYRDLIVSVRSSATSSLGVHLRVNGNSSSIYSTVAMRATVNSPFQQSFAFTEAQAYLSNSSTTSDFSGIAQLFDYAQTNKHKSMLLRSGYFQPDENGRFVEASAVRWGSTDAINSVTVRASTSTFAIGSTFSLYGIN